MREQNSFLLGMVCSGLVTVLGEVCRFRCRGEEEIIFCEGSIGFRLRLFGGNLAKLIQKGANEPPMNIQQAQGVLI
jgi:hypothetical protein